MDNITTIPYKQLDRISLDIGYVAELPDGKILFVEYPVSTKLIENNYHEECLKKDIELFLKKEIVLKYIGNVYVLQKENSTVLHPFTEQFVDFNELNNNIVVIERHSSEK